MDIQTKDGILLRGIPDGTPEEEIKARIQKIRAERQPSTPDAPVRFMEPPSKLEEFAAKLPDIQGSQFGRFIQGAAELPIGAMQAAANAMGVGDSWNKRIAEISRETEGLRGEDAGTLDPARLAGSLTTAVLAGGPKAAPTVTGRIGQGAGMGGLYGTATPVTDEDYAGTKLAQQGAGVAIGAAIPGVLEVGKKGYQVGRNIVEPYLDGGLETIAGRTANKAAGDRKEAVIEALLKNERHVPGSAPTAGEAAVPAGSAEFSGLQKIVRDIRPSEYRDISKAQDAGRMDALKSFAKDKPALDAAEKMRSDRAGLDYSSAFHAERSGVPTLPTRGLEDIYKSPYFQDALPAANKLAADRGITPQSNLSEYLHLVKLSLDQMLARRGDSALGNTELAAVEGVKSRLVKWLATNNPGYNEARVNFAAASKPINEMQVGQYLSNKLDPAVNDLGGEAGQRAAMYAQAVRDAAGTIKRSTGQPMYDDLSQVLSPQNLQSAQGVGKDLARKADFEKLATEGVPAASKIVRGIAPMQTPNFLDRQMMILNAVLRRVQGSAEGKSLDELSRLMQDPVAMAQAMRKATPKERAIVEALMNQIQNPMIAAPAIGAAQGVN